MIEWLVAGFVGVVGVFGLLVVIGGSREEADPQPRTLPPAREGGERAWRKTGDGHLQARCTVTPVVRVSAFVEAAEAYVRGLTPDWDVKAHE